MINLLKSELFKLKKDKSIKVALILLSAFALFSTLIMFVVSKSGDSTQDLFGIINGKLLFLSSLSPTNNGPLVIPIIIVIIVCREFTYGTIRNKVISGHCKRDIYITTVISSLITACALYIFNLLLSLGLGVLFFGYGTKVAGEEILFILQTIGLGTLMYAVFIMITIFISMLIKNTGASIGITLGSLFVLALLGSLDSFSNSEILRNIITFNPMYQIAKVMSESLDSLLIIQSIVTSAIYVALFSGAGIYLLNKNDLK